MTADVFHFVFTVAQFTGCAIRSEADVAPAGRDQAFVSSSRLLRHVACVISVANVSFFFFLHFSLSLSIIENALMHCGSTNKTRLHFYGDMIQQQTWDYTDPLTS